MSISRGDEGDRHGSCDDRPNHDRASRMAARVIGRITIFVLWVIFLFVLILYVQIYCILYADGCEIFADKCRNCPFENGNHLTQFLLDNSDGVNDPPALDAKTLSADQIVVFPSSPGQALLKRAFSMREEKYNEVSDQSEGVFHIGLAKDDNYYVYEIDTGDICWDPENAQRCAQRGEAGPRIRSIRGIHVGRIVIKSGNLIIGNRE